MRLTFAGQHAADGARRGSCSGARVRVLIGDPQGVRHDTLDPCRGRDSAAIAQSQPHATARLRAGQNRRPKGARAALLVDVNRGVRGRRTGSRFAHGASARSRARLCPAQAPF